MGGIGELESGPGLDMFFADGQPQSEIVLRPSHEPLGKMNMKGDT